MKLCWRSLSEAWNPNSGGWHCRRRPFFRRSGNDHRRIDVYAGPINQSGPLEIREDRMGRNTTFGKNIDAVERAEKSRAPIQGIADRLAGYLVYFALGAAALTFLVTHNVRSSISVVIVAGACGIAAPLAILGAIGRSAQLGSHFQQAFCEVGID
jgi:cation transport ATPase